MNFKFTEIETWNAVEHFADVPWDQLGDWALADTVNFIRMVGMATAEQAADVVAAIAKYRQHSDAFVITNDVKIEGISDMPELAVSAEQIKAFDVLAYLYENLEPAQAEVVKGLLKQAEPMREAA